MITLVYPASLGDEVMLHNKNSKNQFKVVGLLYTCNRQFFELLTAKNKYTIVSINDVATTDSCSQCKIKFNKGAKATATPVDKASSLFIKEHNNKSSSKLTGDRFIGVMEGFAERDSMKTFTLVPVDSELKKRSERIECFADKTKVTN